MAPLTSSSSPLWSLQLRRSVSLLHVLAALSPFLRSTTGCPYTSIFSFGDSFTDTGNLYFSSQPPPSHFCFFPPYGQTYFGKPTGRCSDGGLAVDIIAESLGIPMVKPYLGIKNGQVNNWNKEEGVNFAICGATVLDVSFFEEMGIHTFKTNDSLTIQLGWFKEYYYSSLCDSSSSCKRVLEKALFLMGEIGGNDLKNLFLGRSLAEIKTYMPYVINAISLTISELIALGAQTLVVLGNFPIGCHPVYLTKYESKEKMDYDKAGCLKWLNMFVEYYNERLQAKLNRLQGLYPHTNIQGCQNRDSRQTRFGGGVNS